MRKHIFPLFIGASLFCQGVFADSPTLDSGTLDVPQMVGNPTNAITGEVTLPVMKEPIPNYTFETNLDGEVITITNQVMVVPQKPGQRIVPEVRITANGAEGSHPGLGHSIEVDGNLNRSDSVVMHLPPTSAGSVTLQGHAIGVGLIDAAGHQAWLGQLKDCAGAIDKNQPNVVRWTDAFSGIKADVVLIYGQSYIEQLVVLRENPVVPEEIDQATARLFVMSEFYQTPEPRSEKRTVKLREDSNLVSQRGAMMAEDEILDWGWMRMAEGRAFVWQKSTGAAVKPSVPTSKSWQKNGDRVFLLEYADYLSLKPALDELAAVNSSNRHEFLAQALPKQLPAGLKRQSLRLAKLDLADNGVVLDFKLVNSALINVNFGGNTKAGAAVIGKAADNWNSYVFPNNSDVIMTNLAWNAGATRSQVSLRVQNGGGQWGFTTTDPMYGTYIYPYYSGNITLTISNLPSGDYDLYMYGHGGAANQNSTFTVSTNQVTIGQLTTLNSSDWQQSSNWTSGLQYIAFTNIHLNAGNVASVVVSPNASTYAVINGLQISAYNQSPVVSAGPDQSIVLPNGATLTGTATNDSYPPNQSMALSWSKVSGNGVVSFNPQSGVGNSLQTTATFDSPGAYVLSFVADDSQLKDTNNVLVTMNPPTVPAKDMAWMEDAIPYGGISYADSDAWNWVATSPAPLSGNLSHQSLINNGFHQHYFLGATQTLVLSANDWLFCYVYLEDSTMPSEIMLQWYANDGTDWSHRAYWGYDMLNSSVWSPRTYMGVLPDSGRWIRLAVQASSVGLVGKTVIGMAYTLYGGRATWDLAGKSTGSGLADTDGDGLTDSDEVYLYHTDPNNPYDGLLDSDGDGLPDIIDAAPNTFDITAPTFSITLPTEGQNF
jgi:hypothetical protein